MQQTIIPVISNSASCQVKASLNLNLNVISSVPIGSTPDGDSKQAVTSNQRGLQLSTYSASDASQKPNTNKQLRLVWKLVL